ncbi:hypothetical protein BJY59DRAFT_344150 [Rhodotorula toruloides]
MTAGRRHASTIPTAATTPLLAVSRRSRPARTSATPRLSRPSSRRTRPSAFPARTPRTSRPSARSPCVQTRTVLQSVGLHRRRIGRMSGRRTSRAKRIVRRSVVALGRRLPLTTKTTTPVVHARVPPSRPPRSRKARPTVSLLPPLRRPPPPSPTAPSPAPTSTLPLTQSRTHLAASTTIATSAQPLRRPLSLRSPMQSSSAVGTYRLRARKARATIRLGLRRRRGGGGLRTTVGGGARGGPPSWERGNDTYGGQYEEEDKGTRPFSRTTVGKPTSHLSGCAPSASRSTTARPSTFSPTSSSRSPYADSYNNSYDSRFSPPSHSSSRYSPSFQEDHDDDPRFSPSQSPASHANADPSTSARTRTKIGVSGSAQTFGRFGAPVSRRAARRLGL